ncbi:LOW QUALITY PROTEIN: cyclic AMP-dependent transcription factor ATF-2 [Elysia marginata]|uniref:Cyclic AMP-dependent transcription factor ATF-2 n=1 Tax=Elysia marginata TaxID=1093978 RepID=A0AAV4FCV5_9GAST|nr:LOW QUALITY PROTEIN: cyclic AMP-dependent transcription factor ATF-2 [Elysia marginata]
MDDEQDDMPFVCPVADCGMRFINEDHLNWHSKKHEMSLALNTGGQSISSPAHPNFLDQTPTPTKFLKNCEEIGLFQELTPNPFDHAYKKALDDPTAPIPGPPTSGGELNTPTLILSDGHSKPSSIAAPSPLSLEKPTQPTLLLRGAEPLKPSPLATQTTKPANISKSTAAAVTLKTASSSQLVTASATATTTLGSVVSGQLTQVSAATQNKLMLDLSGRSVMADGHPQLLAVAPTTKVATVQPIFMQNTNTGLREPLTTEATSVNTTRYVTSSSGVHSNLAVLKPAIKTEHMEEDDGVDNVTAAQQQQQQQHSAPCRSCYSCPLGRQVCDVQGDASFYISTVGCV